MADTKKKESATERWAKKNKKKTTPKDIPGSGQAKSAGKDLAGRHKQIADAVDGL